MSYEQFLQIKPQLTAALADKIESVLRGMGDDAKKISWFSSHNFNCRLNG